MAIIKGEATAEPTPASTPGKAYPIVSIALQGSLNQARLGHGGIAMANGSILAIGGSTQPVQDGSWNESALLQSCEVYTDGTWYNSSSLIHPRAHFQVHSFQTF